MSTLTPIHEFISQQTATIKVTCSSKKSPLYFHTLPDTTLTQTQLQTMIAIYLGLIPATPEGPATGLAKERVSIVFVFPKKVTSEQELIFNQGITHVHVKLPSKKEKKDKLKKEAHDRDLPQINTLKLQVERLEKGTGPKDLGVKNSEKEIEVSSQEEPPFDPLQSQLETLAKKVKGLERLALRDITNQETECQPFRWNFPPIVGWNSSERL
jgi:hypothetical protein